MHFLGNVRRLLISIHALLAESDYGNIANAVQHIRFLSTLSLRRATIIAVGVGVAATISIHALLAESDGTHSPALLAGVQFLSTLSLRRATCKGALILYMPADFYPRSPCGERRKQGRHYIGCKIFLSTLSLRRATLRPLRGRKRQRHFYPRSPCGERHTDIIILDEYQKISIHALLAESDHEWDRLLPVRHYFYPRSPCGERQYCSNT